MSEQPSHVVDEAVHDHVEDENDEADSGGGARQRSSIKFPYGDLEDAEKIASTIHSRHGSGCDNDQLAADLNTTVSSGSFRSRVASAAIFGAIQTVRGGSVRLTKLGSELADPRTRDAARVTAFLGVELYSKVYEFYRGRMLPPDRGLEAELVRFGVAGKQAPRARQALIRSAETAGFLRSGRDRLVQPPEVTLTPDGDNTDQQQNDANDGDGGAPPPPLDPEPQGRPAVMSHPLIVGLLNVLPKPGQPMSDDDRRRWLETLESNLKWIYPAPSAPARRDGSDDQRA